MSFGKPVKWELSIDGERVGTLDKNMKLTLEDDAPNITIEEIMWEDEEGHIWFRSIWSRWSAEILKPFKDCGLL